MEQDKQMFFDRRIAREADECADDLIALYGADAWAIVYERCRSMEQEYNVRRFNRRVRRAIERKLGISPRVDTATRYLAQN